MTFQITILGLGQIGTSIGMALEEDKDQIRRVGHDKSQDAVHRAKQVNAVDKVAITLSGAVKDADIVILALPFQEIYPVLEHISQDLKEDTLVLDTGPLKQPVIKWAEELLPENTHYVGLTPVLNHAYLEELEFGPNTAQKDLFKDSLMAIVSGHKTKTKAVDMATNLVQLLGASPYFTDPAEMDGLMTMTHIMPQLLAASLLKFTQDSPGWREARKIAGKLYTQVSNPLSQDEAPEALAAAVFYNRDNTTRLLNDSIRTLVEIRDLSETPSQEKLEELFTKLQKERDLWWDDRRGSKWIDAPKSDIARPGFISRLFGFPGKKPPREGKNL
ncbi:MAG: prephenate dehydrogenase [Anaerolineales bacterium]|nr:prephenate dehydrogenase [Anaerolineales bacterium]